MTYRVYVRWPSQRVSDKTTTDSASVARLAFDELAAKQESLAKEGALGVSMSEDGKQLEYLPLNKDADK